MSDEKAGGAYPKNHWDVYDTAHTFQEINLVVDHSSSGEKSGLLEKISNGKDTTVNICIFNQIAESSSKSDYFKIKIVCS